MKEADWEKREFRKGNVSGLMKVGKRGEINSYSNQAGVSLPCMYKDDY